MPIWPGGISPRRCSCHSPARTPVRRSRSTGSWPDTRRHNFPCYDITIMAAIAMLNLVVFGRLGRGQMSAGPSIDSAEPPSDSDPPFTGGRPHSWLVGHPMTWALAALVLVASVGVALIQHQPPAQTRAQKVYCGLVTCAVLRSVADPSSAVQAVPRPSLAVPSTLAPSSAPAHTRAPASKLTSARSRSPKPVATSKPVRAPYPRPTRSPAPSPWPTRQPTPPRWPWPPAWPPTWPWPGGGGWHHHHWAR